MFPSKRICARAPAEETAWSGYRSPTVYSYETLALEMQNDFLRSFFGSELGGIYPYFGIARFFVGIRNAGELLEDARPGLSVETFPIAPLANFH